MTLGEHIARGLYVGWRFLRFDGAAARFIEVSGRGVLRSFAALFLAVPLYWLGLYLPGAGGSAGLGPGQQVLSVVGYILAWPVFAALMFYIARSLGLGARYPAFMTAYNWARVYAGLVSLPVLALLPLAVVPALAMDILLLAVLVYILSYKTFIMRKVLGAGMFHAVLAVAFDVLLFLLFERSLLLLGM